MLLPLAGFLLCIPAFLLVLKGEVAAVHYFYGATSLHDFRVNKFVWVGLAFPLYFVCDCIVIFFNAALVDACLAILKGEEISFSGTLGAAWSRLPQLLSWSFVCAAVSVLMLALRQGDNRNSPNLGGWLMGIGWRIACYLVLPILVAQGLGPIGAVRESVALVRKSWREGLAGSVGLGSVGCVLVLAGVVLFYVILKKAGAAVGPEQDAELLLAFGSVTLVIAVFLSTLGMIFRCGLYLYATTGQPPAALGADAMEQAFQG
jgi:hypothetical protein